jgi:GAF domain-containing protein
MAKVNLEFLSRIISRVQVGATGYAYVLDNRNFLIAEEGSSADTLRDISAAPFIQDLVSGRIDSLDTYQGLKGQEVLGAMASVRTGRWNVVVELPVAEAFAPVRNMLVIMGAALAVTVMVAVGLGIFSAQRIVVPLQRLTEAATHISAGQFTRVAIANQDELGLLAGTFNVMADQLEGLYATLEQQVASRTQRLELIAALGERLSAILSLEELLPEIVNQVKLSFDYYHVHIYLLDQAGKNLTVVAGIGEAGAKMINRHSIPLNAPTSLVARAARTGQVVRVDNVREAEDWLPNPLLPDTFSEMAVPIVLGKEEQVVGVLDVQEDKIAGLDEEDADLLQTLANQVAVAIRNARLFNQVQSALAEVQAVQERYIERSWEKAKMMARGGQFHYARNDAPVLAEAAVQEARQQAVAQEGPAIIAIPRSADPAVALEVDQPAPAALVAPITLRDKVIGVLQLHAGDNTHSWSEDDLLVIEAVVDQLAQTAETLRLFEDTRLQASYESLLIQITNKLRRAPTLDLLAKVVAEELGQALGVSHSSVQLGTVTGSSPLPEKPANGHNSSN